MFKKKRILAIIPARKNSKRIKNKNLLKIKNKSLVEISLLETIKSKYIDKIIISSDSIKINKIASKYNCLPIKIRSKELSSDSSKSIDLVKFHYSSYKEFDYIILLQPTSPFRKFKHINESIKLIVNSEFKSLISVEKIGYPKSWIHDSNNFQNFTKLNSLIDKKKYYKPNGAIYIINTNYIEKSSGLYFRDSYYYEMDTISSIDIDNKSDYIVAKNLENFLDI